MRGPLRPAEITTLTGISNEMVSGKRSDPAAVSPFVADANIVIAQMGPCAAETCWENSSPYTAAAWAYIAISGKTLAEGLRSPFRQRLSRIRAKTAKRLR